MSLQRDRQQADRHLLAGRRDDVDLARIGIRRQLLRQREQPVRLAGHRRDDDDELVALRVEARDALRDVADALDRADRRAAVLLDDQRHHGAATHRCARNAIVALVPPKPNEFDSAARIFIGRATRGTKSRSHCGSTIDKIRGRRRDLVADRQRGEHRLDARRRRRADDRSSISSTIRRACTHARRMRASRRCIRQRRQAASTCRAR